MTKDWAYNDLTDRIATTMVRAVAIDPTTGHPIADAPSPTPFDYIPEAAREEVSLLLRKALVYRGWDRRYRETAVLCHAANIVQEIADVLEAHGRVMEECT